MLRMGYLKDPIIPGRMYNPVQQDVRQASRSKTPSVLWRAPNLPSVLGRLHHQWGIELLAAILFTVDFGILVAVLRAYQGEPLPKWPLGLSFNTALSVLGAIFRAPTLFIAAEGLGQLKWRWLSKERPLSDFSAYDDATRGPWGSTKLLYTARWRDSLAFLGALLTVVSLGIDPFTQAVVSYHPCTAASNTTVPYISRINSFFSIGFDGVELPPWAAQAIVESFNNPTSITPNYTCTTDSCAFAMPYHSIGLCARCVDITNELHTECMDNAGYGSCSYTLSRNTSSFEEAAVTISNATYDRYIVRNTTAGYTYEPYLNTSWRYWDVLSTRLYYPGREDESHQGSTLDIVSAWPLIGCRCRLSYCVRTYTATIDHGVLHETLQSTSDNWSTFTDQNRVINTVRIDCLEPHVQRHLLNEGYVSVDTEWMAWNATYLNGTEAQDHISNSPNPTFPAACVYQIQFSSRFGAQWRPVEAFTNFLNATTLKAESKEKGRLFIQTDTLTSLYNNATISIDLLNHAFDNFTTAASSYMRTFYRPPIPRMLDLTDYRTPDEIKNNSRLAVIPLNPVPASPEDWNQPVTGQAFVDTTCIHVRWPWLALPAAIFLGTLVFLAILIVKTTSIHELEVWKSSQNALIWHGLDGSAEFESDTLVAKKDMDSRAKEIKVRLEKTRRSWKLVQDE
jgi:hypothetical protein